MNTLFIIDIDGTIADHGRRIAKAGPEPSRSDKEAYFKWVATIQSEDSLLEDKAISGMEDLVSSLDNKILQNEVVYLTGREEQWRGVTERWFYENNFPDYGLIMRPDDDYRDTAAFKEDAIDDILINFRPNAVVVIDDDQSGELEKVCKRRGWTFLKAMSGSGK